MFIGPEWKLSKGKWGMAEAGFKPASPWTKPIFMMWAHEIPGVPQLKNQFCFCDKSNLSPHVKQTNNLIICE